MHHVYTIFSPAGAPAGGGDEGSWFRYYKWDVDGEGFLPKLPPHYDIKPGELLWVMWDGATIGAVRVKWVHVEALRGVQEVWFEERLELPEPFGETALTQAILDLLEPTLRKKRTEGERKDLNC